MAEPLNLTPEAIAATAFALLDARAAGRTICPSEVARALAGNVDAAWRPLMPAIREAAAGLVDEGRLRVTRGGVDVPARAPGGPIRLGRPASATRPSAPTAAEQSSRAPATASSASDDAADGAANERSTRWRR